MNNKAKVLLLCLFVLTTLGLSIFIYSLRGELIFFLTNPDKEDSVKLLIYCLLTLLTAFIALPIGVISKVLAGWLFGFSVGAFISHTVLVFSSWLAFSFSRFFVKDFVEKKYGNQLARIKSYLSKQEFLTVLRVRFFPFIPLQISNFVLGVTPISTKNFLFGSFIGMLPATLFYASLGDRLRRMEVFTLTSTELIPYYIFVSLLLLGTFLFDRLLTIKKQKEVLPHLKKIFEEGPSHFWDEQAVPSYLHPNFFVRLTFWKRITSSFSIAPAGEVVLDFGCGAGAMLPWLVRGYRKVLNFDTHEVSLTKNQEICAANNWANVSKVQMTEGRLAIEDHSIDTIFALDVLEHVNDLPVVLEEFKRVLKPTGKLVVSSPTENAVYKFVRKFGGPGYQGEYHLRAAKEVEIDLAQVFKVKLKNRIFPIFTFFRIVEATPRSTHKK